MATPDENALPYNQAVHIAGLIHKSREKETLTMEEQEELTKWLNASEANRQLFASLQDRERVAGEVETLIGYDVDNGVSAIFEELGQRPPSVTRTRRLRLQRFLVAASILLLVGVGGWFIMQRNIWQRTDKLVTKTNQPGIGKAFLSLADGHQIALDSKQTRSIGMQGRARVEQQEDRLIYTAGNDGAVVYNTLTTSKGGQYHLVLSDGSEVWLNAASSVTYPTSFAGNAREISVTGEAYLIAAKDETKPMVVMANTMKVQVLGTTFNVMAYEDEDAIRTTLISGAVKIGTNNKQERTTVILKPGEQGVLIRQSGLLHVEKPDPDEVTGWRTGMFRFHETNIPAIMRQIARWYDVNVIYQGPADDIKFSGQISRKERVEDLLEILSDTRNVHFEVQDHHTIVVIPGPR